MEQGKPNQYHCGCGKSFSSQGDLREHQKSCGAQRGESGTGRK